jgi:hypothetical protein
MAVTRCGNDQIAQRLMVVEAIEVTEAVVPLLWLSRDLRGTEEELLNMGA